MAYNNKIPNIGKTSQSLRDIDFISITEVKAFDALIDEIVSKLSVIGNENSNITDVNKATNIAQEIKKIEFNMADAINKDGSLNISNSPDPNTGEIGGPVYGEYSMYTMLTKLDNLYSRFISLVGEHQTEWRIPLDNYYNTVYNNFKDTVISIFKNSVNSEILEQKVNSKYDYTKRTSVKLDSDDVMRLNPDIAAYPRTINLMLSKPNTDYIAFEITELETDNLVFHMNFFNGSNYFRFNIIIDNNEVFITKEESFKFVDCIYTIKIWKHYENNANKYTITLSSNCQDSQVKYSFEIEGLLVGTYDFSSTGFELTDHKDYYEYELIDKSVTEIPVYNITYYYKEYSPTEDGSESTEFIYKPAVNLRNWKNDVEYYERKCNFNIVSTIDISKDQDSGTVSIDNKTIDNKDVTSEDYPIVVNKKNYTKPLYYKKIDMDASYDQLFKNKGDKQLYLKNHDLYSLDDGAEFFQDGMTTNILHTRATSIDGKQTFGIGNKVMNIFPLRSNAYEQVPYFKTDKFTNISSDHLNTEEYVVSDIENEFPAKLRNYLLNKTDGISSIYSFQIGEDTYILPQFKEVPMDTDGNILTDISILKYNKTSKSYESVTNCDLPAINLTALVINDAYYVILNDLYDKFVYNQYNNSINQLILKFNKTKGLFEEIEFLKDAFSNIPYIDYINSIKVQQDSDDSLIRFLVKCDNNTKDSESFTIIYNYGAESVLIPEKVGKYKPYVAGKELKDIHFISTAHTNNGKAISVDNEYHLWFTDDGESWKYEDRIDYDILKPETIYCDTENRWFILTTENFGKIPELWTSQNGYEWEQVDTGVLEGKMTKFKNLAINRYFLFTIKYVYISEDGITNWTKLSIPEGTWRDIAWNTKKYVVVGVPSDTDTTSGAYQAAENSNVSTLANNFIACTGADGDFKGVLTYDDKEFVIFGKSGVRYSDANYTTETTTITFAKYTILTSDYLYNPNKDNHLVNGRIYLSNDAAGSFVPWGYIDNDNNIRFGSYIYNNYCISAVEYSDTLKIYVAILYTKGIYYSYDGLYFTQSNITTTSTNLAQLIYWDSQLKRFFAHTGTGIYWSDNGKYWSLIVSNSYALRAGFIRINSTTLAFGTTKNVWYTNASDGKSGWTAVSAALGNTLFIVTNTNKTISVATTANGIQWSTDGKTWTKSNITNNVSEGQVIYDKTNDRFLEVDYTNKKLYQSIDGKTWSQIYDFGTLKPYRLATNGKVIVVTFNGDGIYYSIDNGTSFTKVNIDSKYNSIPRVAYYEDRDTFYIESNYYPQIWYSKNGIDWNTLIDESIFDEDLSEADGVSTRAEDPTAEDVLGYYLIWKGKNLYRSRDGRLWQKVVYNSEINSISFDGIPQNSECFLTLKDGGIYISSRNTELYDGLYSLYGASFEKIPNISGNYGKACLTIDSDENNVKWMINSLNNDNPSIFTDWNRKNFNKTQKKEPNNINYLGNLGDTILAVDKTGYLQWSEIDNYYTPNVIIGNRDINFINSVGYNKYLLGTSDKLIIASDADNNLSTKDFKVIDIFKPKDSDYIYAFRLDGGLLKIDNTLNNFTVDFEDVYSGYVIMNMFQKSDNSFITVASKDNQYHIFKDNKSLIASFSGSIDFVDLINDKLVLLAHGLNDDGSVNYLKNIFFNNKINKIVENNIVDNLNIIHFNKVVKYNNELYVVNIITDEEKTKTVSFCKLTFSDDDSIILNTSDLNNKTYTITNTATESLPEFSFVIIGNKLYCYSSIEGLYKVQTTDTTNGWTLVEDMSLIDSFIENEATGNIVSQENLDLRYESYSNTDKDYREFKADLNNSIKFKNDKLYFDKETSGMALGKYWSKGKFVLKQQMITAVKSQINNKVNIAIALGADAKIALYDKKFDSLKVLNFKYSATKTGSDKDYFMNISDSDEAVITDIYSGSNGSTNYLFFVVKDKFTKVTSDPYGNFTVSDRDTEYTSRLFKVSIDDILNNINEDKIECIWLKQYDNPTDIEVIKTAFNADEIIKSDVINVNSPYSYQYVVSGTNLRYEGVDSIAWFDVDTSSLVITTKIRYNSDFARDINEKEDINYDLITEKVIACQYDKDKKGKLNDNDQVTGTLFLGLNTDGTIKQTNNDARFSSAKSINGCNFITYKYDNNNNPDSNGNYIKNYKFDQIVNSFVYDANSREDNFNVSKIGVFKDRKSGIFLDQIKISDITNGGMIIHTNKTSYITYLDPFSDGTNAYYNDFEDTSEGTFRWFNIGVNSSYYPNEYPSKSINQLNGWIYFTPKNKHNVVKIFIGKDGYARKVYDTYAGIFICTKEDVLYGKQSIETFNTYRLITIPTTDNIVDIHDEKYFERVDTGEDPIIDMKETSEGIFAITFLNVRTCILRWDGSDFYVVRRDLNYAYGLKLICDTIKGVYFVGDKKEWAVFKYDADNDEIRPTSINVYMPTWMDYRDCIAQTEKGIFFVGTKTNTDNTRIVYEVTKGKSLELGDIGTVSMPTELTVKMNDTILTSTNKNAIVSHTFNNYFDKLSKKLVDDYNIPVDTPIKTSGNIVLNDVIVPIKGIKIVSEKGVGNYIPNNITFAIDNDARFNEDSWNKIKDCVKDGNIIGIDTSSIDVTKFEERIGKINLSMISSRPFIFNYGGGDLN